MTRFRPTEERELVDIVAAAAAREEALELVAGGSKRGLGRPMQTPHMLDLTGFSGILFYEPEELVLTAGAATPLAEIEAALAAKGQMLGFEPPDWRALLGAVATSPTIGGTIACNLAGPRRVKQGAARDHFLGFRAVSGRGEAFKAGGKVVKNVTGYDLSKLMAGSHGTLAALTEITVKVLPQPEETAALVIEGLDDETAVQAMTVALNSAHEVSGAAHGGGERGLLILRLEGFPPSVAARAEALKRELASFGTIDELRGNGALTLWRGLRDLEAFRGDDDRVVWRVSVPPSAGPGIAKAVRHLDSVHFFDWGGGLVWLGIKGTEDGGAGVLRRAVAACGGHATLVRAPDALRQAVPVFEPMPPTAMALTRLVKESFDPRRILNRGRMYPEL